MDEIKTSKRRADMITKSMVIVETENDDTVEQLAATERLRDVRFQEGRLIWEAITGIWMATSTLEDWEANIKSYKDSTGTQKSRA